MNITHVIRFVGDWAGTAALATTITVAACSHSQPPAPMSPAQKGMAADAAYAVDRAACRDITRYPTVEKSDACAEASRMRFHRLPDGGADGTYADGGL